MLDRGAVDDLIERAGLDLQLVEVALNVFDPIWLEWKLLGLEIHRDGVVARERCTERHHPVAGAEVEHAPAASPDVSESPRPLDLPVAGQRPLHSP